MTQAQEKRLPELMQNFIMSSQMEGLTVDETLQNMCLSILKGTSTLEDCLAQISQKYPKGAQA